MRRSILRVAAGTLMVAGISLVAAPLAAAAHSGSLYTWAFTDSANGEGFATISRSNAALAPLATQAELQVTGADVCDEVAWAVTNEDNDGGASTVLTWDHSTGVLNAPVVLTADVADFPDAVEVEVVTAWAADSLADCSKIAYVRYSVDDGESTTDPLYVSFVDVATGATTPIAEIPELSEGTAIFWEGIATDPVTGSTYLFAEFASEPYFSVLDIATGVLSGLQEMQGLVDTFLGSEGFPLEADFQPDGILWLLYGVNQLEEYHLVSFAASSDLASALATDAGNPNAGATDTFYEAANVLTYDPSPILPATGGAPIGMLLAGGALFIAGLALVAVRRGQRDVRRA